MSLIHTLTHIQHKHRRWITFNPQQHDSVMFIQYLNSVSGIVNSWQFGALPGQFVFGSYSDHILLVKNLDILCSKSFVLWSTEPCCSAGKSSAPRSALASPGSSEKTESCLHLLCETAVLQQLPHSNSRLQNNSRARTTAQSPLHFKYSLQIWPWSQSSRESCMHLL